MPLEISTIAYPPLSLSLSFLLRFICNFLEKRIGSGKGVREMRSTFVPFIYKCIRRINMCANTLGGAWKLKPARPARSRNLTQPAQPLAARYKQKRNERDKPTFSLSRSLSNTLYRTLQEWSALERKKKRNGNM